MKRLWYTTSVVIGLALLAVVTAPTDSGAEEWQLYKPSNTGIPGGVVQYCTLDPEDNVWVAAFDPFWQEGGIAMFDRVKWTTYSNLDSPLPTHRVWVADFAAGGTTWLGTEAGVVRFNRFTGEDWSVYTPANSPLPGSDVRSLDLDSQGRVWLVYWDPQTGIEGVAMFDGERWQTWTAQEMGFGLVELHRLAVDTEDNVWVGTRYSGGIAKYDGLSWTVTGSAYPAQYVTLGGDGHIWAVFNGLRVFDGENWIPKPELPGATSAITVLSDGTYWLGTFSGIIGYFNGSTWTTYEYGQGAHVYSVEVDRAGEVWCAGNAHLRRLDDSRIFRTYNNRNTGLTEYFINDFAFDTAGIVWFATSQGGICAFDGSVWRGFNPDNDGFEPWPFDSDSAEQVAAAPNGDVWANPVVALGQWDGQAWTTHLPQRWIEVMAIDPAGHVWAAPYEGLNGGLGKFNGVSWESVGAPWYTDVIFLEADPQGRIWMGVTGSVMVYNGMDWTIYDTMNSGLPSPDVYDIAFHPDGSVWIATYAGLARLEDDNWTVYTTANSGLRVDTVLSVAIRGDGLVAAGAFRFDIWPYIGGVSLFDGQEWIQTYTLSNSPLQHEQIESLAFDPDGRLWISSGSEGVARVNFAPTTGVAAADPAPPAATLWSSSKPNPFSGATEIRFTLPETARAKLSLYDANGRRVGTLLDQRLPAGEHAVALDGRELQTGIYFYRLRADRRQASGKLVLQR